MDFEIPSRREAIEDFRKNGGKIAAVFPIHYPRALLRAHNILPLETWGPSKADLSLGEAHLQSYTCSVVRYGLSYLLGGGFDVADMFLVPHCCDTLQGLGSILLDFSPRKQPAYIFYIPRDRREMDIAYFARELSGLSRRLTVTSGVTPDEKALTAAIEVEELASYNCKALFSSRSELSFDNREFYQLVRSREYLPAEKFNRFAQEVLEKKKGAPAKGIPIILSGVVPEPAGMLDALTGMGFKVVGDDCLSTGRRIYEGCSRGDPWSRMAEAIIMGPPDSTLGISFELRLRHLKNLIESSGAKGVVFCQVKFCEPEQFYLPMLRKGLKEAGIPSVTVEADIGDVLSNQVITRLEAFVEMIS